jgi:hypothetical protein
LLSSSTFKEKKQKDDDELGRLANIYYTWKKKQRNDDELRRFAVICYIWEKKTNRWRQAS